MAKKTITVRTYIGGNPMAKVTYETNEDNKFGKKFVRLTLDEVVTWMITSIVPDDASWAVTYTDGNEELAFSANSPKAKKMTIEIDGEKVTETESKDITLTMWEWLKTKGWY